MIWVFPFFIRDYSTNRAYSGDYWFIEYLAVFGSALLVGIILFVLNIFFFRWEECDIGKKYFIVIGSYASTYPCIYVSGVFILSALSSIARISSRR